MGAAAYGSWRLLILLLGADTSRILLCGAPIALGVLVYVVLVVAFKCITRSDCLLLPKGDKIANFLRL